MPSKKVIKPSQPEAGNNVISQPTHSENSQKKDPANPSDSIKSLKKEPANPKGDLADPANSVLSQKSDPAVPAPLDTKIDGDENMKNEELSDDNPEGVPVDEIPNSAPSKTENSPDSSKKTLQQGTVNASNQSGKILSAPAPFVHNFSTF